jgi:3-oxoacyl-[acyl-carrier protein] reductase
MADAPQAGRFDGRVALVTGSSRGIGAAIATLLAARGARVAVHGRDAERTNAVRDAIVRNGGNALAVRGDVTVGANVEAMRAAIEAAYGSVDVLVTNAGGNPTSPASLEDIDEAGWRAAVDANLTTTFLTIKAFLPRMKARRRGAIVTMASAAARMPNARSPIPYGAAKAGIVLLTADLAAQAGPDGVRVNCVAPATILTEENAQHIPAELQRDLARAHPLQRLGTPDDVARAVAFLASDEAAWISGVTLDIAGGLVLR